LLLFPLTSFAFPQKGQYPTKPVANEPVKFAHVFGVAVEPAEAVKVVLFPAQTELFVAVMLGAGRTFTV
jgi:hypothetical protein